MKYDPNSKINVDKNTIIIIEIFSSFDQSESNQVAINPIKQSIAGVTPTNSLYVKSIKNPRNYSK